MEVKDSVRLIVLCIVCSASLLSLRLGVKSDICGLENTAWQDGEELTYKLYYNLSFIWIPAGEVTFRLKESDETFEAQIEGRSYKSYDNFFRVRDLFFCSINKETMRPLTFIRRAEEGDHYSYDSLMFDYKSNSIYSFSGTTRSTAVSDTFNLEDCTESLVSIMYNLRNIDINKYSTGDRIESKIFFDNEYSPITIDYINKEHKKVRGIGEIEAIKVRPKVIIGTVFKQDDIMNVWVSDDNNKIPVVIESPIRIGKVKAILSRHQGLKYPLKYKVN